uniref:Macrolide phosphotransferase K (mphK) n=1 Tax=Escherichia coli TaxID=562 RepID=Q47698_ECOLX|nr:orf [Escherichia coli]
MVIVRAARAGSTHAPSRPARTEQNAVSPSVGAAPSRPIAAPPRAGPPRIATFPITAFSDETRSTESPATWPSLGSSLSWRGHTGCVERGTEHHASDQPSVREGANGIEQWDARHGHAAHHTRDQCDGRAPEPIDEATTNPRADDGRDDAASGRGARPGRALFV